MTGNHLHIMNGYKEADFTKRLHIYMEYPDLRAEFMSIDQEELNVGRAADLKLRKPALAVQMSVLLSMAKTSIRRMVSLL